MNDLSEILSEYDSWKSQRAEIMEAEESGALSEDDFDHVIQQSDDDGLFLLDAIVLTVRGTA